MARMKLSRPVLGNLGRSRKVTHRHWEDLSPKLMTFLDEWMVPNLSPNRESSLEPQDSNLEPYIDFLLTKTDD